MAQGLYHKWLEEDNLALLRGWKRNGWTDEQIAQRIGVAPRTFEDWKKKFPQIMQSVKIGKEQVNFTVENVLLQKALEGNTTAMIFWLKNNWRDKYNDSQLSPDELALAKAKTRKVVAEANIAELKAAILKQSGNNGVKLLEELLDKIEEGSQGGTE